MLLLAAGVAAPVRAAQERAAPDGCRAARAYYRLTARDVLDKLADHRRCVVRSDGKDDCSGEFLFLHGAQDAYEAAMAAVPRACGAGRPAAP